MLSTKESKELIDENRSSKGTDWQPNNKIMPQDGTDNAPCSAETHKSGEIEIIKTVEKYYVSPPT